MRVLFIRSVDMINSAFPISSNVLQVLSGVYAGLFSYLYFFQQSSVFIHFFCRVDCIFGFRNVLLNSLGSEVTLLSIEQIDGRMCVWPLVGKSTKLKENFLDLLLVQDKSTG